jgi:hypothetical protein
MLGCGAVGFFSTRDFTFVARLEVFVLPFNLAARGFDANFSLSLTASRSFFLPPIPLGFLAFDPCILSNKDLSFRDGLPLPVVS